MNNMPTTRRQKCHLCGNMVNCNRVNGQWEYDWHWKPTGWINAPACLASNTLARAPQAAGTAMGERKDE